MTDPRRRLIHVQLDEKYFVSRRPEVEHERKVAIYDLIEDNSFYPTGSPEGPYNLHLSAADNRLIFDVRSQDGDPLTKILLPMTPFKTIVRDYFLICDSYFSAIKKSTPSQIEAIDMGRRGLHNQGSELLRELLSAKVELDFPTARRLFTLVCVLHIRG